MVIRLPGMSPHRGPQAGPDPAWAQFTRTSTPPPKVSLHALKPDITAYHLLGAEQAKAHTGGNAERNRHNSSVYVSNLDHQRNRAAANVSRLPVIGEIAAGQYDVTVAFQEYDCLDYENGIAVDKGLARGGAYALRVRGTSMTHVGIEPGDVVIVRPQSWADNGDFVVANVTDAEAEGSEGLATLKRFYKRRDHVFLQSATASTDPIRLYANGKGRTADSDPIRVQGVVTMVIKQS